VRSKCQCAESLLSGHIIQTVVLCLVPLAVVPAGLNPAAAYADAFARLRLPLGEAPPMTGGKRQHRGLAEPGQRKSPARAGLFRFAGKLAQSIVNFCSETGVEPTLIAVSGVLSKHQLLIVIGTPAGATEVMLIHA